MESQNPANAPAPVSTSPSTTNWRAIRHPVAPSARRVSISAAWPMPRERNRFAMLAQPIRRMHPTAPKRANRVKRWLPTSVCRSGVTLTSVTRDEDGWRSSIRRAIPVSSPAACCGLTPGFSLPKTVYQLQQRAAPSGAGMGPAPQSASDNQIRASCGRSNAGGITPIIWKVPPRKVSTLMVLPRTARSPPNRSCQYR